MTKEEAIKELEEIAEMTIWNYRRLAVNMAIEALSAEAGQRGEWEPLTDYIGNEYFECSKCHDAFYVEFGTPEDNNYNFCPNCGADMKGQNDGQKR